jgi:hypothetical protein
MISGRQTLDGITRALKEEQARLADVDRRLKAANERILAIDAARAKELAALARVRVGHLARGGAATIASSDERVAGMLAARSGDRQALEASLRDAETEAARLEAEREGIADALEAASADLDAAEATTQHRLEGDEAYRAQRERASAAERTARHADEKARASEEERAAKGRAFEADPIFMDLWRRGYGTSRYRAWFLMRLIDRRVARLVGFDANRATYSRLVELPVRLREHAEAVAAAADDEIEALHALDQAARREDGVDALERARVDAAGALERHDAAIAAAEAARREAFERLERMDRGEDDAYGAIVNVLTSELQRADVQALRREALATPYPEDDAIVARLLDLERERAGLAGTVDELKVVADRNRSKVQELEALRREFTARGLSGSGTGFPDGDLVTTMLTQFLRGAATREALWRVLEAQRRTTSQRSNPTFGSGGFGRGSPWGGGSWSRPTRGTGPFGGGLGGGFGGLGGGAPKSGGMPRGGGFRTGGRMGGGGFRTGGKR